eukprot:TRINITY_DN3314_c0_g1_i1.p1 TRINITY_DN3314_c0_g1~~TRINITY_DN3314_c0_g1_i1.p1  ORF type:complete len:128 (+),score=1.24 TRINITY_DN3314_c0_g1_i1:93-476(+)
MSKAGTECYRQENENIAKALQHSFDSETIVKELGSEFLSRIIDCLVEFLRRLVHPQGNQLESGLSKVIFCQFTCDNLYVITGSSSGSLKIWDFQTTKLVDKVREWQTCRFHYPITENGSATIQRMNN